MKKNKNIFMAAIILFCICFISCENEIIGKWWVENNPDIPFIREIFPQVFYETIIQEKIIYEKVFIELPPETIIEYVTETVYIDKIVEVIKEVPVLVPDPVTPEKIIEYIENDPDIVREILERIVEKSKTNTVYETIIKEIIKTQPPQRILQTIQVVNVEFILFSGDAVVYNGARNAGYYELFSGNRGYGNGTTDLTSQEITTNNNTILNVAQVLPTDDYYLILHGHANPVTATADEINELKAISTERARVVKLEFMKILDPSFGERITASGYGGESTIAASTYQGLNRRVEVILIKIITTEY